MVRSISLMVLAISVILETHEPTPQQFWAADMNGNGTTNIVELVEIVNLILGKEGGDISRCVPASRPVTPST